MNNNKKTTLLIMAAGLGSRYGGNKQTEGMGPNHEMLMEYSIYDAVRAGFNKFVFVIKPEMTALIQSLCGSLMQALTQRMPSIEFHYAVQDFTSIPSFYSIPQNRVKPFGTVHAVLCAKNLIQEPFAVINADDYYGVEGYKTMYDSLQNLGTDEATMVSYYLKNTISPNGTVTRGVCSAKDGWLTKVTETYKISPFPDGTIRDTSANPEGELLDPDALVSMNFWGFSPAVFQAMEQYFEAFLHGLTPEDIKAECLLPIMVDAMVKNDQLRVRVLSTHAVWFGVTYPEDKPYVQAELAKLHQNGVYPASLL